MSRLRILGLTLLLLTLALPAGAAQDIDIQKLIAAAPGADDFPTADVITLAERIDVEVDAEGLRTYRVHQVRRILTNWAMRRVTDPRVGWDSSRQTLEITTCRTYQEGGAVVDSPANALNEVTPDAVGRCAEFLDLREMVISHVGLEPGCVTELEYVLRDLEPGAAPAAGQIFLQDRWPVLERIVSLRGPGLQWELVNAEASVEETDGVTITVRDVPGLPDEGNGAHRGDYAPSVVYAYGSIVEAAEAMAAAAIPEGEVRFADWLAEGITGEGDLTPVDSIQRIAELIGEQTRGVHLPAGLLSRAPRPAGEVFDSGCASAWEQALLAASLLDQMDLQQRMSRTVWLVPSWETLPLQNPLLGPWNDVVVSVQVDDELWWLSPSQGKAWRGAGDLAGHTLLIVTGPDAGLTLTVDPAPSASSTVVDIREDDGIFVATTDWEASGAQRGHEMDLDKLAEAVAQAVVPGSDVTGCELIEMDERRAHLRVQSQFDDLGEALEDILLVAAPSAPVGAMDLLPRACRVQEPVRYSHLYLPGAMTEEITVRLHLPEGLHVDALPAARRIEAAGAHLERMATLSEGVIHLRSVLTLPDGAIAPGDWPALRQLLATAGAAERIILTGQE